MVLGRLTYRMRNARAAAMVAVAVPPNPFDCMRGPTYGDRLPQKMGAGGWPIEEPSIQEVDHFNRCLDEAIRTIRYSDPNPFGGKDAGSMENTEYTDVIKVRQWLKLLVEQRLLYDDKERT